MKTISIIYALSNVLLSFAQTGDEFHYDARIHFNGKIEFDSTSATVANVIIFQDSVLNSVNSDSTGKYNIIAPVDLKKPFSIKFSCTECVEKTLLFNLENINLDHPSLVIRPLKLIEWLDMEMIPINTKSDIQSFDVARFYWNQSVQLDKGHALFQKLKIENYRRNIDTTRNTYYPNGQLSAVLPMKDGLLDGTILCYDENGTKTIEMNVKNNELNGELISYYSDGSIKAKSTYTDGKFIKGQHYYYSDNGELINTIEF